MSWNFELIQEPYGAVTEGPVWDGTSLLYTQIQACRIMRFDPRANSFSVFRANTNYANGLAMDSDRRIFACEGGARRVVCYDGERQASVLADEFEGKRFNIPNDLVIDSQGRIWFTDPFYEGAGGPFSYDRANKELDHDSVYRLAPQSGGSWSVQRMTFDTTRPNGLLFSPDEAYLYVAQSGRRADEKRELRSYPVQANGTLGAFTVLHDFGAHRGVDGMCLDAEGNIVATAGADRSGPGPSVYVFSPSGEVLNRHPVPAPRPTNCCFGGEDLRTLFVTTTDGHLFQVRTETRGYPLLESAI